MRIVVLALGSRGDVQPYLALARGLRHVGHEVLLAATPTYAALARAHGVPFAAVGPDWRVLLAQPHFQSVVETGRWLRALPGLARTLGAAINHMLHDAWGATSGAQALIATVIGPLGASLAERRGIPYIEAALQPFTPTAAFASPAVPAWRSLGPTGNRLSHLLLEQLFWQLYRRQINQFRRAVLGLAPYPLAGPMEAIRQAGVPRLYAFSPRVVPRPADWPATTAITGYWFLPPSPGWRPAPALQAFLDTGPPPVYVGFGSMVTREPERTLTLVLRALTLSGQRGLLARGWGGLPAETVLPATVTMVDEAPHAWLFPRMAALVHHGGAGTTGAGLRAGVPSIVVPHLFDQAFWGERVAALGAGPPPLPRATLTAERLAETIAAAMEQRQLREGAASLGAQIRAEQGVAHAIDHIHRAIGLTV